METKEILLLNLSVNLIRYFLFAGIAYLIFYVLKRQPWALKKIQLAYPDQKQLLFEIKNSIVSIFIFALVAILIHTSYQLGITKIYAEVNQFGWLYLGFSFILLIFWHDTYFYWSHRFLHLKKYFKFHLIHHTSHNTTPFTSFSFHPVEAIIQTGFLLIIFLLPIHIFVIIFVIFWQMLFNVIGHLGFEIFPKSFHHSIFGKQVNTVTHHNMHHRFTHKNYSLYFNFWDRIMKTNHQEYEKNYVANAEKMYPQI